MNGIKIFKNLLLISLLISLTLSSCSYSSGDKNVQSFTKKDTCTKDRNNTYFVYVPGHSWKINKMPLVLILDPHGSGEFAVNKFIAAAEEYKCILVGSNQIRNGFNGFINSVEVLTRDIHSKYAISNEIYLAGFSGGARMAISIAQLKKFNGVLTCGALSHPDGLEYINTQVYSIIGLGDFNLPEAANFFLNPNGYTPNLNFRLTETGHEWPSPKNLSKGIGFLMLKNCESYKSDYLSKSIRKSMVSDDMKEVDSLLIKKDFLKAYLLSNNYSGMKKIRNSKYFLNISGTLKSSIGYSGHISRIRASLRFEFKARDEYIKAMESNDIAWWRKEVQLIQNQSKGEEEYYMSFTYKRILAYLGIVCYSAANTALVQNDLKKAGKVLEIYKVLEPDNPDMYFFSALFWYKNNDEVKATEDLRKAIDLGYTDYSKISVSFNEKILRQIE